MSQRAQDGQRDRVTVTLLLEDMKDDDSSFLLTEASHQYEWLRVVYTQTHTHTQTFKHTHTHTFQLLFVHPQVNSDTV